MKNYLFAFLLLSFFSCNKETVKSVPDLADDLASYVELNPEFRLVTDSLIACAVGGQSQFLTDAPISILFYPEGNASEFVYFETANINVDPDDFANYQRIELPDAPMLNGYMHRFKRIALNENIWCRVSFVRDGNLHISNPIRIKYNDLPTEYNAEVLTIVQQTPLSPTFQWEDGRINENQIYFQIVHDENDNLISGTYTFDQQFQFYDLSNVVLNVSPTSPTPVLQPQQKYTFVMLGVSIDSWVNLIVEGEFETL